MAKANNNSEGKYTLPTEEEAERESILVRQPSLYGCVSVDKFGKFSDS